VAVIGVRQSSTHRWLAIAVALLLLGGVRAAVAQPEERGTFRPDSLTELITLDRTIKLDIRYATPRNFMHRAMYTQARAFLQRPAAEALLRAHRKLARLGYGLLIFDGYRPWSVTKQFWDETPPEKHSFVADPSKGSKHNRGCAVDLSLYDLKTGKEIIMPCPYDEFTKRASPHYTGGSPRQRRMRELLRTSMEREGFSVDPGEWWHFDYRDWTQYRVLNIPFEELGR
jgi:D-alanyl-D-alanine dipeptidase